MKHWIYLTVEEKEVLVTKFEKASKLLVAFEELPTFSTAEWVGVSSKLKRKITSNTITLEEKNCPAIDSENLNNKMT